MCHRCRHYEEVRYRHQVFNNKIVMENWNIPSGSVTLLQSRLAALSQPFRYSPLKKCRKKALKNCWFYGPIFVSDCLETLKKLKNAQRKHEKRWWRNVYYDSLLKYNQKWKSGWVNAFAEAEADGWLADGWFFDLEPNQHMSHTSETVWLRYVIIYFSKRID